MRQMPVGNTAGVQGDGEVRKFLGVGEARKSESPQVRKYNKLLPDFTSKILLPVFPTYGLF